MPSPFPGMDPYLEAPERWPGIHILLIGGILAELNRHLRPKYVALVEERVYISDEDDPGRKTIIPDVRIRAAKSAGVLPTPATSAAAVAEPIVVRELLDDEIHETRLEIIDVADKAVVTVLEVVSPTNKTKGAKGQRSYRAKRREVMLSDAHWVEIDLLRSGRPTFPRGRAAGCDYAACVSRTERRPDSLVWPIRMQDPLPEIRIPLRSPDPDVPLHLQPILNAIYENAAYDLVIDYRPEPVPPLTDDQATWADALLRERGLRT